MNRHSAYPTITAGPYGISSISGFSGCMIGFFLLFVGLIVCLSVASHQNNETLNITVRGKERVAVSDGKYVSSKYLIFSENEVFENTDDLFAGKFNSSDLYGQLQEGQTYKVQVYGWRMPVLSMYRNIVRIVK